MKIKLNEIEIEIDGDAEITVSNDGKYISIKPQKEIALQPVSVPTTPIWWPNVYPWVQPQYPNWPNPWSTIICAPDAGSISAPPLTGTITWGATSLTSSINN